MATRMQLRGDCPDLRVGENGTAPFSALLVIFGLLAVARVLAAQALAADPPAKAVAKSAGGESAEPTAGDSLSLEQQRITDKYKHLEDVLIRMTEVSRSTDPRRAVLLKKAVEQSKEQLIAVRLERLAALLGNDQLSRALENQTEVDQDLHALLELLLSENRAKHIESEKARIREYLKRIGAIINQQKDIQGRTIGGGEPQRLAGEQGKLGSKTSDLARDIQSKEEPKTESAAEARGKTLPSGGGSSPSSPKGKEPQEPKGQSGGDSPSSPQEQSPTAVRKRLHAAEQRMKEAEAKLKQTQPQGAGEKQEEAIRELQLAKAKLEEILRQLREEEIERVLTMLEARFRKMLQMQEEVYEGTVRLDKLPSSERTHSHEIEASRLSGRQSEIVVEMDKALLLLRDDGSAVAVLEAAQQTRDDMQQVVARLAQSKLGKTTQNIEEDVLAALKEMVDALAKARKDAESKKGTQPPRPGGQPQDPPLVDLLSELKMIRALQMRVNTRTARYATMIEGEQADGAELIGALRRLADRQQRIYRVTHDLQMGKNE